jgi:anti-sigma-K factor RskA
MDLAEPDRRRRLELVAAEYALGTLPWRARARLEGVAAREPVVAAAVADWEQRLAGFADAIAPVAPPAHVYTAILARLGLAPRAGAAPAPAGLWNRIAFWRAAAIASFAALVVLGVAIFVVAPPPAAYVVTLAAPGSGAVFVASAGRGERTLHVKPLAPVTVPADRALELWALPATGAPIPLGLVDARAGAVLTLAAPSEALLADAKGLAVSLEPPGGSPTGQPTGPILWSGPILPI